MATPASQTINFTLADATAYANNGGNPVQRTLDDALITAQTNAVTDNADKTVIIQITPPGATVLGFTGGIKWTQAQTQNYLYPPGDSTRDQPAINSAVLASCNQASATGKIT